MTGPQYPPGPQAGSNGIGLFQIGISPIGDIPAFNYWTTVLSQYANSPILTQVIANIDSYIDPTQNLSNFYDLVVNVLTAQGYGLDVWGRIVGVNRVIEVANAGWFGFSEALPGSLSFFTGGVLTFGPSLGFAEAGGWQSFGQGVFGNDPIWSVSGQDGGPFYPGAGLNSNVALSDPVFLLLILAKAATNITNGSIPAINQILMNLFPNRGNAYVTEGYSGGSYFGFAESENALTFGQGAFYDNESIASMTMTYTFDFALSSYELAIVGSSGVLPKPTGVAVSIVVNGMN